MSEFFAGLRHASRTFRTAPGFAALAVAILATGVGASTLMYTLVQNVLLRELPFQDPERLVWMYNTRTERDRAPISVPDLEDYRREASSLTGMAVFTNWTTNLIGVGTPERLDGVRVSGNFFELLGTRPAVGRTLRPDDETRESRVAVLTYGLWQRRFGGDAAVVGSAVSLNGATYTIVGVLQPRFLFPSREAEIVYGVTAFAARVRRRELAIRSALGASRSALTWSILRGELLPVLLGLAAGFVVALMTAPYLFGGAFETSPRDFRTYVQVATLLLAVAVLATYIPVRRAGATNPSEALTA